MSGPWSQANQDAEFRRAQQQYDAQEAPDPEANEGLDPWDDPRLVGEIDDQDEED